jgi:hypothetical protein
MSNIAVSSEAYEAGEAIQSNWTIPDRACEHHGRSDSEVFRSRGEPRSDRKPAACVKRKLGSAAERVRKERGGETPEGSTEAGPRIGSDCCAGAA